MKYKYDEQTDTLIIELSREAPDHGEQSDNVIYHYNNQGKPVEIEFLNASITAMKIVDAVKKEKISS
tara:strand:+ start:135 stop:335 length:201 start_codon:yes stop_codon:yes gene_type:complete